MNKIDVSIWGIRAGFEDSGIFHSHNFADVKELQKDIYRGLADLSRPRNAYLVNRTSSHTVVTILHTDSFEYVAAGNPRSGYVAISLIFDKNKALSASPRTYLQQFVQWYKSVQGNNRANNFTAEQIQGIISQLTLVDSSLTEIPGRKAVPFNEEIELDAYLTGGNKYVRFTETLFFDASVPFEATGLKNDVIKMTLIIKDVEDSEERQRQIALEAEQKRQVIAAKEQELAALKNAGQVDQLIQAFDAFTYNQLLRSEIRSFVDAEKLKRAKEAEARDDERIAKEIRTLIQGGNVDVASAKLSQLRDQNRLSDDERRKIQKFRDDERKKKDKEQTARAEAERKEKRKRTILTYSLVAVVVLLLATVTTSIILKYPASMYKAEEEIVDDAKDKKNNSKNNSQNNSVDSDGDTISDEDEIELGTDPQLKDTDADGIEDNIDRCPLEKGVVEKNGCKVDVDKPDLNKLVTLKYKNKSYSIKQGFLTEQGLTFNHANWRYFKENKWEKESNPSSGVWTNATNADVVLLLKGKEIKVDPLEDTDLDGVKDKDDKCPNEKGDKKNNGCPQIDSDSDGVWDKDDKCPNEKGDKKNKGCPDKDSDGDGVKDKADKCPNDFGDKENDGCPELSESKYQDCKALFKEIANTKNNDVGKIKTKYLTEWNNLYKTLSKSDKENEDIKGWHKNILNRTKVD